MPHAGFSPAWVEIVGWVDEGEVLLRWARDWRQVSWINKKDKLESVGSETDGIGARSLGGEILQQSHMTHYCNAQSLR